MRISTTRWVRPEVSPLRQSALRERLKYQASPLAMVFCKACAFMCATIRTSPERASVATQVTSPSASNFGAKAQAVIDAFAAHPGKGTVGIDGVMYDRPHLERAKQLVARAMEAGVIG